MSTSVPTLASLPSSSSATGSATSKPKRKRSEPNDDNPNQENPRRPQNSFFLFFGEKRGARPDKMPLSAYARQTGLEWCALPPEEREVYEKRAEQAKLEHARMYPDYKYKPRKGGTKRAAWGTRAPKRARKSTTSPSKNPSLSLSSIPPVEAVARPIQHTTPSILSQSSGFNGNGPTDDQSTVGPSGNLFSPEQHELFNRAVEGFHASDYSLPLIPEVNASVQYSPMSQVEQIWHRLITEPLVLHQSSASSSSQSSLSSLSQSPLSFSQSPLSSFSQSPFSSPSPSFTSEMGISSFHHPPLPSSNWDSPPPKEMYPPFMGSLEDFMGHAPLPPHHDSPPSSLISPVLDTDPVSAQYFHTLDPAEVPNAEVVNQNSGFPDNLLAENQPTADFFSELYPWAIPEYSFDSKVFAPGYGPEPSFVGTWSH